jgi:hypothetical protein
MKDKVNRNRITTIIGTILFIILFGFMKTILMGDESINFTYITVINTLLFFVFFGLFNLL